MEEEFYQFIQHPSIKPYIGDDYETADKKIFVIGESHYIKTFEKFEINDWYDLNDQAFIEKAKPKDGNGWFYTDFIFRNAQQKYSKYQPIERAKKIMWMIPRCMHEVKYNEIPNKKQISKQMSQILFFNFFSRPVNVVGASIEETELDIIEANKRFEYLVDKYRPDKVFVLSKKVFFCLNLKFKNDDRITFLDHTAYFSGWSYKKGRSYIQAIKSLREIYNQE